MLEPNDRQLNWRRGPILISGLHLAEFDDSSMHLHVGGLVFGAAYDRGTVKLSSSWYTWPYVRLSLKFRWAK